MRVEDTKTIVITGCSDGLGKTLAEDLSKNNNVIILVINEAKLKGVASEAVVKVNLLGVMNCSKAARLIRFIINMPADVMIPEVGIKNTNN